MRLKDYYINKTAFAVSPLAKHMLIGGGVGAAGGAALDKKHRVRGALIGGALGAGVGAGASRLARKSSTAGEAVNKSSKSFNTGNFNTGDFNTGDFGKTKPGQKWVNNGKYGWELS